MAPNPSVRSQIHSALVAALGGISVAAGFNTDVSLAAGGGGAWKLWSENSRKKVPVVFVLIGNEQKIGADNDFLTCRAEFEVIGEVAVKEDTETEALAERLDLLLTDIEKVLLTASVTQPILGVVGGEDLAVIDYAALEAGDLRAAGSITGSIQYRHRVSDPSVGS